MLWHHNARVNSHQRWKQTQFRVCFHLWCELTSSMKVTEWQVPWNSCVACGALLPYRSGNYFYPVLYCCWVLIGLLIIHPGHWRALKWPAARKVIWIINRVIMSLLSNLIMAAVYGYNMRCMQFLEVFSYEVSITLSVMWIALSVMWSLLRSYFNCSQYDNVLLLISMCLTLSVQLSQYKSVRFVTMDAVFFF